MTERIEVDYTALRNIVNQLKIRADLIEQQHSLLLNQIQQFEAMQKGRAAQSFQDEMTDITLPALRRLYGALASIQDALMRVAFIMQSAEQEAANLFKGGAERAMLVGMVGAGAAVGTNVNANSRELVDGGLYDRNGNRLPPNARMDAVFIPGILTSEESFASHLEKMGGRHGGNFGAIYNQSDSFHEDIGQAIGDRLQGRLGGRIGADNPAVVQLQATINDAIRTGRPLTIEAHSQGGAITSAALMEIYRQNPNADLSKITVNTYGSAGTNFPPGHKYTHYVLATDPVPLLGRAGDMLTTGVLGGTPITEFFRNRDYYANVVMLAPTGLDPHTMDAYYAAMDANVRIPTLPQVIDKASELSSGLLNKGKDLFNQLISR